MINKIDSGVKWCGRNIIFLSLFPFLGSGLLGPVRLEAMVWTPPAAQLEPASVTPEQRALVSAGDGVRLARVLAKARRGEPVTVAVIGGSITGGASADKGKNYGERMAGWWRQTFPKTAVTFVNAGIGATGSDYAALRVRRDLLDKKPDFVVVEFAVNDRFNPTPDETMEGLLRQILKQPQQPSALLLFMMDAGGNNTQDRYLKTGLHYGLPMISYRDALWPEIQAGRLTWQEISPDSIHPNNRGHGYAADRIIALLKHQLDQLPADSELKAIPPLPAPLLNALYEFTELREGEGLQPVTNTGWSYDAKTRSWNADKPGASLEFEIAGRILLASHWKVNGPMGRVRVTVDGGAPQTLDCWFKETWGGYRRTTVLASGLAPGPHRVRFAVLPETSEGSTGNGCRILGVAAAGQQGRGMGNGETCSPLGSCE